jgi:hypothetical protein
MAAYDLTRDASSLTLPLQAAHAESLEPPFVASMTYDSALRSATSSDYIECIDVPPNTMVMTVVADVLTAETTGTTFDVGDAAGATQFMSNVSTAVGSTASAASTWKYYPTGGTIRITPDGNIGDEASKLKVRLTAVMFKLKSV